jgi:UPF0755 protein
VRRFLRDLISLFVIAVVGVVLCGGIAYIVAGDRIVDAARVTLARWAISSRAAEINQAVSNDATPIRFTVALGASPRVIADNLQSAGLIADSALFLDYVRANALSTQLEAGTYFLNRTQTIPVLAQTLTDSAASQFAFQILPGWRIEQIGESIDQNRLYFDFSGADFLALVGPGAVIPSDFATYASIPSGASLEGFMFPDTYQLPATVTAAQLRDILLNTFRERVGTQIPADAAAQGLTLYEIVTFASIIQREALHNDEHVLIASVYRNRYAINMKLDADPTIQYALNGARGRWWPVLTVADYTGVVHPYNTYLSVGLPPSPIASPSLSAIRGATYPAESNYIYFRAKCDRSGYHNFAVTYEEQIANAC